MTLARRPATRKKIVKRRARRKPNPFLAWRKRLDRTRPGLIGFTLDGLRTLYGPQAWVRRWDPTSELVMTILTQNSADVNAEHAFEALRRAYPSNLPPERYVPGPGWGGVGLPDGVPPAAPAPGVSRSSRPVAASISSAYRPSAASSSATWAADAPFCGP